MRDLLDTRTDVAACPVDVLSAAGQLTRRSFLGGIGLAAGTLLLAACGAGGGAAGATPSAVELLAILDLTGPLAPLGMQMAAGAALAIAQVNKSGGVLGRSVSLTLRDSGSDPRQAQRLAALAESAGRHKAVLVGPLAQVPQGAKLTYVRAGVDLGAPFSARELRSVSSLGMQLALLGRYARDRSASRLHLVVPNLPWLDPAHLGPAVAASTGLQLAGTSVVALEQASFAHALDDLTRSGADCLLSLAPGAPQASLLEQLAASPAHGHVRVLSPVFGAGGEQQQAAAFGNSVAVAAPFFAGMPGSDTGWLRDVSARVRNGAAVGDAAASAWVGVTAWAALVQHGASWDGATQAGATAHLTAPEGAATADTSLHRVRRTVAVAVADGKGGFAVQPGYSAEDAVPAPASPGAQS